MSRLLFTLIVCASVAASFGQDAVLAQAVAFTPQPTELNTGLTALDEYVAAEDDAYEWKVVSTKDDTVATTYVIDLTSQKWLTPKEVNRTLWRHWLTVVVPKSAASNKSLLFIGGGSNNDGAPRNADQRTKQLAVATNSVVAELKMVPNQPLIFHNDGVERKEDDLIGYTWDQFLKTGDARWPARLPMVKSAVRAMDTVQALAKREESIPEIDAFMVAGGSKRGWTTWMTAAVDKRVIAIAPIVIDVLNTSLSMQHHYSAYGFWAPAVGDYERHQIMARRRSDRHKELLKLVDPFAYRDRLTMPKCIINASGDQFFLPDSSQFYFDELPNEKHLCYVPNAGHSLDGSNAVDTLVAFYHSIVNDRERPEFTWSFPDKQTIRVETRTSPKKVVLWQATNPKARDFRIDSIGKAYRSSVLEEKTDGVYVGKVTEPEEGWTAFFVQLEFDVAAPTPLRLSTAVRVVPDVLPFIDKVAPLTETP